MLYRCCIVSRYFKGGVTVKELYSGPLWYLMELEAYIDAENDEGVKAYHQSKHAIAAKHAAMRNHKPS